MRFAPTLDERAAVQPLAGSRESDERRARMPRRAIAQPAIDENCHVLCEACQLYHHIDDDCPPLQRRHWNEEIEP